MEFKLEAGGKFDLFTMDEAREVLAEARAAWKEEISRGLMFRDISAQTVQSGPTFTLGAGRDESGSDILGPREGFVWFVTRLWVTGPGLTPAADMFTIYKDDAAMVKVVAAGILHGKDWDPGSFPLWNGQKIVIQGASTGAAGGQIVMAAGVIEAPEQLAWQML